MRFVKYLALLALASVPLLLADRKKKQVLVPVDSPDDDNIFERDLKAD